MFRPTVQESEASSQVSGFVTLGHAQHLQIETNGNQTKKLA